MKRKVKMAEDLSIKDDIFQIQSFPMVEHENVRKKDVSLRNIRYFSLAKERIKALNLNEDEDKLIINGKLSIPLNGKIVGPSLDDTITDEGDAVALILVELAKEKKKAYDLLEMAEDCIRGLEENMKIYQDKAKDLNIHVEIKNNGEVVLDTDDPTFESLDEEEAANKKKK